MILNLLIHHLIIRLKMKLEFESIIFIISLFQVFSRWHFWIVHLLYCFMRKLMWLVNQIRLLGFIRLTFTFLICLCLPWSIFIQDRLSFIIAIIFISQHFSIRFILFLFIPKQVCQYLLTSLSHAFYEFILEF